MADGDLFGEGTFKVGAQVSPGTYRTRPKVTKCYWERSTSGGGTIANGYVMNAPGGVTVRISASDGGFMSEGRGIWTRVK